MGCLLLWLPFFFFFSFPVVARLHVVVAESFNVCCFLFSAYVWIGECWVDVLVGGVGGLCRWVVVYFECECRCAGYLRIGFGAPLSCMISMYDIYMLYSCWHLCLLAVSCCLCLSRNTGLLDA